MFHHKLKTINRNLLDLKIAEFSDCGVADNDVIVSLTSFPERINEIHYTIYSLLNQSYKPSKIILWLACEEFPNKEKDLPEILLKLKNNGLTINWCNNLYSYKKLIPALKEFPDKILVTADDDVYYEKNWLKILVENSKVYENTIICHRAHRVKFTNKIEPYKKWKKKISSCSPSYKSFFTGIGGVLYPPNSLYQDVLDENLFTNLAPKADDVWFWAMAVLNHTKIYIPKNNIKDSIYINPERERGHTNEITLFSTNKNGGNDIQLKNVIEHYPQIIEILRESSNDNIIKSLVLFLISIYRKISKYTPAVCRFQPTCSEYTYQAIQKYGVIKGLWLGIKRICRCHPGNEGGYDPLP